MAKKIANREIDVSQMTDQFIQENYTNHNMWHDAPGGKVLCAFGREIIRLRGVIDQMNIDFCEKDNYDE